MHILISQNGETDKCFIPVNTVWGIFLSASQNYTVLPCKMEI